LPSALSVMNGAEEDYHDNCVFPVTNTEVVRKVYDRNARARIWRDAHAYSVTQTRRTPVLLYKEAPPLSRSLSIGPGTKWWVPDLFSQSNLNQRHPSDFRLIMFNILHIEGKRLIWCGYKLFFISRPEFFFTHGVWLTVGENGSVLLCFEL